MKLVKCLFCLLLFFPAVNGQNKSLRGSGGLESIPMVNIWLLGVKTNGIRSKEDGTFSIRYDSLSQYLRFSAVGYTTYTVTIDSLLELDGRVILQPAMSGLTEVFIAAKNSKATYSHRNNPAVEFFRQVILHLDDNNARASENYRHDGYEMLCVSPGIENKMVLSSELTHTGYPGVRPAV